ACGCAVLNAWPMGFYHPATVVKDAQRHGVRVLPVCAHRSAWRCTIEDGAVRLGLRFVAGLRQDAAERLVAGRPFGSVAEAARQARPGRGGKKAPPPPRAVPTPRATPRACPWPAGAPRRHPPR